MSTSLANKKFVFSDAGHCLVFGFGAGLIPRMPGTAGTVLAFPLYWGAVALPQWGQWGLALVLFALGVWLCGRAGKALGVPDDSGMVADEIVAFYLVLLFVPASVAWQAAAFVLFRFFDAVKPPPINWLDKNIGGGAGVMVDDAVAAGFTVAIIAAAAQVL